METEAGSVGTRSGSKKRKKMHLSLSYHMDSAKNRSAVRHLNLFLLYYHIGFLCSLSKPYGGWFDANDTKRSPISGGAATWQTAAWEELRRLNTHAKRREHRLNLFNKHKHCCKIDIKYMRHKLCGTVA